MTCCLTLFSRDVSTVTQHVVLTPDTSIEKIKHRDVLQKNIYTVFNLLLNIICFAWASAFPVLSIQCKHICQLVITINTR